MDARPVSDQARNGVRGTAKLAWLAAAAFIAQVAFVLVFAARTLQAPTKPGKHPRATLAIEPVEQVALADDPTLFPCGSANTFSGHAWFQPAPQQYQPFYWREPPAFLDLSAAQLGSWFLDMIENEDHKIEIAGKLAADPAPARLELAPDTLRDSSKLEIEGDIAARRLLSKIELPAWYADDVLRPTVVRVVVDAAGQVHSATLLSRSGSDEADQYALAVARAAEWEPAPEAFQQPLGAAPVGLVLGTLTFTWRTLPPTAGSATEKLY
ncbi:MAG: energy transducer TonB [Verrucomicrobiae bacterium]|nr:energy transducer TonB [Verrucomicrobiae bacterium]